MNHGTGTEGDERAGHWEVDQTDQKPRIMPTDHISGSVEVFGRATFPSIAAACCTPGFSPATKARPAVGGRDSIRAGPRRQFAFATASESLLLREHIATSPS